MKVYPLHRILPYEAIKVTAVDNGHPEIWRYELDQYAISTDRNHPPHIGFKSRDFSIILNCMESPIVDFSLIHSECLRCEQAHEFYELRFVTEDGQQYILDSYGEFSSIRGLELTQADNRPAFTPHELWGVPEVKPFDRLLVTLAFADQIQDYMTPGNKNQILESIYFDLQQLDQPISVDKPVNVTGEYGSFVAIALYCGRIVLFSPDEDTTPSAERRSE